MTAAQLAASILGALVTLAALAATAASYVRNARARAWEHGRNAGLIDAGRHIYPGKTFPQASRRLLLAVHAPRTEHNPHTRTPWDERTERAA